MCDFVYIPFICRALIYNNQAVYGSASILASFAWAVSIDSFFCSI